MQFSQNKNLKFWIETQQDGIKQKGQKLIHHQKSNTINPEDAIVNHGLKKEIQSVKSVKSFPSTRHRLPACCVDWRQSRRWSAAERSRRLTRRHNPPLSADEINALAVWCQITHDWLSDVRLQIMVRTVRRKTVDWLIFKKFFSFTCVTPVRIY